MILLHWTVFMLLWIMVKGGEGAEGIRWAFVVAGAIWIGMTLARGMMARPGPKLQGAFRRWFRTMHAGVYALMAVAVVLNATALLDLTPLRWAWNSLLALLGVGTIHGIFHLWRHTALNDGALRMITPRFWHKHL